MSDGGPTSQPALAEQLPRFISWLLSFAILCRLWTVHHDLLAEGDTRTRGFAAWNFVFLGAVSFIPYPASLLAEHPEQLLSVMVFSAAYVVAGIALGRMRRVFDLSRTTDRGAPRRRGISRAMLLILATAAGSCLLALFDPRLGAALWFSYPIIGGGGSAVRAARNGRGGVSSWIMKERNFPICVVPKRAMYVAASGAARPAAVAVCSRTRLKTA